MPNLKRKLDEIDVLRGKIRTCETCHHQLYNCRNFEGNPYVSLDNNIKSKIADVLSQAKLEYERELEQLIKGGDNL